MAFDNEKNEVLGRVKKNDRGKEFVISKISDISSESTIAIDIRQYYLSDDGPAPTKKGVRIPIDKFSEVFKVLMEYVTSEDHPGVNQE